MPAEDSAALTHDAISNITFFDLEVGTVSKKLVDIGTVQFDYHNKHRNRELRTSNRTALAEFVSDSFFACGHNIFAHDLKYVRDSHHGRGRHSYACSCGYLQQR